jgi:hypothetical protein
MILRGLRPGCLLVVVCFACAACAKDADLRPVRSDRPATGRPFAPGTVGAALREREQSMQEMRRWYGAVAAWSQLAVARGEHSRLDFPLDSNLASEVHKIASDSTLVEVLAHCKVSHAEFVLSTAGIGILRIALQIVDSLGSSAAPTNVGESVVAFARSNREEFVRLDSALAVDASALSCLRY